MTTKPYMIGYRQHDILVVVREGQTCSTEISEYLGFGFKYTMAALFRLHVRGMLSREWMENEGQSSGRYRYKLTDKGQEALKRKAVRGYDPGVKGTSNPSGEMTWSRVK